MGDMLDQITEGQDPITRIVAKIPGFKGYIEKQNRRAADKMLRETIAEKYKELWKRITNIQQDMASSGEIMHLDDMEKAAMKIQTFTDKVENASYGYAGFFDAVKVDEDALAKIYEFDASLLDMIDGLTSAIDNVEASIGSDGLPAAIRHLVGLTRDLVSAFDTRDEVLKNVE